MRTTGFLFGLAVAAFLMTGSSAMGDVIVQYGFGVSEATTFGTTASHANASGTDMDCGTGCEAAFSLTPVWDFNPSYPYDYALHPEHAGNYSGVEASAVAGNTYFDFTVTPDAGYQLDLTQLEFDHYAGKADTTSLEWWLYSDVDNFVSPNHIDWAATPDNGSWHTYQVDLTAAKFQGLLSIEFRVYFDSHWANQGWYDNFELTGTVDAIPEPGMIVLLGTGALGLVGFLRRRRMK